MTLGVRQMQRAPGTTALDRFLMLYAGRIFAETRASPGATLLQKVMFWIRLAAVTEELTAPSYGFLRYHHGPYSADVAADARFLEEVGLVQQGAFLPTPRGMEILAAWEPGRKTRVGGHSLGLAELKGDLL